MNDVLGGLLFMTMFLLICLFIAITEQHELAKQRREREHLLLIEQHERELEANAVAMYRLAEKERMRESLANWKPIQFEPKKPKPNRKYGVRHV